MVCAQCQYKFYPKKTIFSNTLSDLDSLDVETYAWQKPNVPHTRNWLLGSLLAFLLLVFQIVYFTGYPLSQTPQLRPWLDIISKKFDYTLPVYRNLTELATIGSSFEPINANSYRLQISFINQADFDQSLPSITLTLHNYLGGIIAQRIFTPQEYLHTEIKNTLIKSTETINIDMYIEVPEQEIGGYSVELQ